MSQKKFAYGRVSSSDQNEDRQVLEFLEYGINERDIFIDKQSGRTFNRTNYLVLRDNILLEGDVLVVNTMRATGFTKHDYALRHHGGYLGQKSRS